MAKITDLTTLSGTPATGDYVPIVDVSDTTHAGSGTTKKVTRSDLVGGLLPLSAGSGNKVTGILYLDPGADDIANVLKIPVVNANGADFNMHLNAVTFGSIVDTTFNWGFNNSAAGRENTSKHAWYLQMEYDFNDGGARYAEYHLTLTNSTGATSFRPFQYQYKTDGTSGILHFRATNFAVGHLDGTQPLIVQPAASGGTHQITITAQHTLRVPPSNANAFKLDIEGSTTILVLDSSGPDMTTRTRLWTWKNAAGTNLMDLSDTGKALTVNGAVYALATTDVQVIHARSPVGHTKHLLYLSNNSDAIQFAILFDGKIKTNQAAANTNTPSGATAQQLPIYNAAGTLLGYIPVYGSAW